jgi:hypothetical protein
MIEGQNLFQEQTKSSGKQGEANKNRKKRSRRKDSDGRLNFQERIYNQNPTTNIVSKTCMTNQQPSFTRLSY